MHVQLLYNQRTIRLHMTYSGLGTRGHWVPGPPSLRPWARDPGLGTKVGTALASTVGLLAL